MKKNLTNLAIVLFAFAAIFFSVISASASANMQNDLIAQGKYIATIAGCTSCHTNLKPEFLDFQKLSLDQIRVIAFDENQAHDSSKLMAGGKVFNLGPAGVVMTSNITQSSTSGIGAWTDDQIQTAITTGAEPDGSMLFPVMPYHTFSRMAQSDLSALIAYLRTVPGVDNVVPPATVSKAGLQPIPYQGEATPPSISDKAARGAYLVNNVMACTDCHTPLDPATGAPMMDKYLAGGQPYEGPWGIVYGGNMTPDVETGLGSWTEEQIKLATIAGVSKDGRRLILMPWYAYAALTSEDADALAYYLKNVLPVVKNEVPPASLNPDFNIKADTAAATNSLPISTIFTIGVVVLITIAAIFVSMRSKPKQA
jgi:mono/diheme cytochrome c family protein